MTVALLLSGVVCGAAAAGTKITTHSLLLPDLKIPEIQTELDHKKMADQTGTTSLMVNDLPDDISGDGSGSPAYQIILKAVREELRQSRPTYALKILENDPLAKKLKHAEFDRIKAQIAQSYLMEGKVARALVIAEQAIERSGKMVPLAGWIAGQASWRNNDYARAAEMFGVCAKSPKASAWLASGGAYWAARSATRAGNQSEAKEWHKKAAQFPRTFYGLISLKALGRDFDFNWEQPDLSSSNKKKLGLDIKV
ncbi:MAG: hypothetical protein AAB276_04335, partial [Pseudomonadota bacterium]